MVGGPEPTRGARPSAGQPEKGPPESALAARLEGSGAWGRLAVLDELPGGNRNGAVLVEREGERLVAKTTRRSPEALAWLTRVHRHARAAGIEVPELIPSLHGHLVEDGITLERWIDGRPADAGGMASLRSRLRTFHDATRTVPQRPGFTSTGALIHHAGGGDVDLTRMPTDLVAVCRSAWEQLVGAPRSAVHGDLHPNHILETPEGRIALIDWDEARADASILDEVALSLTLGGRPRPGWEPAELALRAWEVAASWQLEPGYARRVAATLPPTPLRPAS